MTGSDSVLSNNCGTAGAADTSPHDDIINPIVFLSINQEHRGTVGNYSQVSQINQDNLVIPGCNDRVPFSVFTLTRDLL